MPVGMCVSSESVGSIPVNGGRFGCAGAKCTRATSKAQPFKEAKVSSMKTGLRRVGIVGLSTLVATSMMSLFAAPSFAAADDYAAASAPNVALGATGQSAGDLSLQFANAFTLSQTQTFKIEPGGGPNDCSVLPASAGKAIGFAATPTVTVTGPIPANADTTPTFSVALTSSTSACNTAGVKDLVTITETAALATGTASDVFTVHLSNIRYNVGATAPVADVYVYTAGSLVAVPAPNPGVVNAIVTEGNFTNTPVVAALQNTTTGLGTQTFQETTAGGLFPAGATSVTLTLSGSCAFTAGVIPTISVPGGYTYTNPATAAANSYTFTVTAPATPVVAKVTVTGLTTSCPNLGQQTLSAFGQTVPVINVVRPLLRIGGATRYETAAALFDTMYVNAESKPDTAVLARGDLFPDALSANYLAGRLNTGTLLSTPLGLSSAARVAILTHSIRTVYITGGTVAISQAVQDQIEAMHVDNNIFEPFILTIRLGGPDRYDTNLLVNESAYSLPPAHTDTALMASGANFPDALSVGPVAHGQDPGRAVPMILTRGTTLGGTELQQLADFGPTNVVIAGGTAVISQGIQDALTATPYKVLRLAGADRTLTAAAVATWETEGSDPATGIAIPQQFDNDNIYIANGANYPDALAAGPLAGLNGNPILLTGSPTFLATGIPSYLSLLSASDGDTLTALGLTAAVSNSVMQAAAASFGP
jgi:putative cell wall-binding protein